MELCLDQYGSLLSGPDSVGDVVVKLNPSRGDGLRCVSLLDLDDEGAAVDPILPSPVANAEPAPALEGCYEGCQHGCRYPDRTTFEGFGRH